MPTPATISITPGTGQFLDAVSMTIGGNLVVRETMIIADPVSATNLAGVTSGGALKVDGSGAIQPVSGTIAATQSGTWNIGSITTLPAITIAASQTIAVTQATAASLNATVIFPSAQHVIVDSGASGGTQYTDETAETAGAFTVTAAGLYNGTDVVGLRGDASNNLYVNLHTAIPAGTNVIGHVIVDSGSITASIAAAQTIAVTNAGTFAVQATLAASTAVIGHVIVDSGTITSITDTVAIAGTLTHNNAAPAATEVGVLPALANAAAPTFTEGKQVLLSTDLSGNLRVIGTFTGTVTGAVTGTLTNNNAAPSTNNIGALTVLANAAAPTWTEGDLVTASSDLAGNLRVLLHAETTKVIGTIRTTGNIGGVMDAVSGGTKPANVLQVGGNDGTNAYPIPMSNGGTTVVVSGTVASTGNLTNNSAAPAATEVGVLPAVANAAPPTWTETHQVLESVDLQGSQRTRPGSPTTANWLVAAINFSTSGPNTVGPTATGAQTVRIMRIMFVNSDPSIPTTITLQGSVSSVFSGPMRMITAGSYNGISAAGEPLFTTAAGESFQINSTAAVAIAGSVWYTVS